MAPKNTRSAFDSFIEIRIAIALTLTFTFGMIILQGFSMAQKNIPEMILVNGFTPGLGLVFTAAIYLALTGAFIGYTYFVWYRLVYCFKA